MIDTTGSTLKGGVYVWRNNNYEIHRIGGPSWYDPSIGYHSYHKNGNYHRTDGPARIWHNEDCCEWWLEGIEINISKLYQKKTKLSDEQMAELLMRYPFKK